MVKVTCVNFLAFAFMRHFNNHRSISESCVCNFVILLCDFDLRPVSPYPLRTSLSPLLCLLVRQPCRWCTELAPTHFPVAPLTVLDTDLEWFGCI
jgi:hypothetical protein